VISVSDGTLNRLSRPSPLRICAANPPPTISGTPATSANAGTAYSFTPTASDPNGNALTFQHSKPAELGFVQCAIRQLIRNTRVGRCWNYSNIIISVMRRNIQRVAAGVQFMVNAGRERQRDRKLE